MFCFESVESRRLYTCSSLKTYRSKINKLNVWSIEIIANGQYLVSLLYS